MKLLLESQLKVIKLSHILKNLGSERERERDCLQLVSYLAQ